MQIDLHDAVQIIIYLGGLIGFYASLKVRIEVLATKLDYLEKRLIHPYEKPAGEHHQ